MNLMRRFLLLSALVVFEPGVSLRALTKIAEISGVPVYAEEVLEEISGLRALRSRHRSGEETVSAELLSGRSFAHAIDFDRALFELAWENVARQQVAGLWARDLGISVTLDYAIALEEYEAYEEARMQRVEAGAVIFGPADPTLRAFLRMERNDLREKIKSCLLGVSDPSDVVLRASYEEAKDPAYCHRGKVKVMRLELTHCPAALRGRVQAVLEAYTQKAEWDERDENEVRETVGELLREAGLPDGGVVIEEYGEGDLEDASWGAFPLVEEAYRLGEGGGSRPIRMGQTWWVLICLKRDEDYFVPFESVRADLVREEIDRVYQQGLRERRSQVQVRWEGDWNSNFDKTE